MTGASKNSKASRNWFLKSFNNQIPRGKSAEPTTPAGAETPRRGSRAGSPAVKVSRINKSGGISKSRSATPMSISSSRRSTPCIPPSPSRSRRSTTPMSRVTSRNTTPSIAPSSSRRSSKSSFRNNTETEGGNVLPTAPGQMPVLKVWLQPATGNFDPKTGERLWYYTRQDRWITSSTDTKRGPWWYTDPTLGPAVRYQVCEDQDIRYDEINEILERERILARYNTNLREDNIVDEYYEW
ncbi:hypothetical protein H072_3374 [Dactylellina haptotyla CBS 200.50]|uniref:Uncharacterized protein n=1 Tax=Dactylellina haptotyla (strain CBS 200.50) TaxID=1284197 RepID=S8AHR7_DACHA|nr:hypothetical protein H072_3374 [Dactylellina haptotyla CBS 200.50]